MERWLGTERVIMFNFTALPPLSLYIHVPWCVRKCPYCDFNSHKSPDELPEQPYIDALIRDLEQEVPHIWGRTVQSIFIGGGTPSLFSAVAYERLFSSIRALLPLSPNIEITLEANPGTFESQRFSDYRDIFGHPGQFQAHLQAFRRAGQACTRCGHQIVRSKLGGRSIFYCSKCQF